MNVLQRGSQGPQVKQLQERLNEIYEEQLKVDGIFGEHTDDMVIDFQRSNGLKADGIVGPLTWQELYEEPGEEGEEAAEEEETAEEELRVISESDLLSLFGRPRDPAPYLKIIDLAEFKNDLSHVKDYLGHTWSCRIYGHKLLEAPLRIAFKNLISRGYAGELRTFDGCVCVRPKTSGNGWSTHAWGLALDFNAGANGYGRRPTLSAGFVKCFTDAGFEWGGSWRTPDGMHFQLPES